MLVGDGVSTVEQLLWEHPRYRLQVPLFLQRHDGTRVLADGEPLALVTAGNHCQGAMFLDGADLITPALSARVDAIARARARASSSVASTCVTPASRRFAAARTWASSS